MGFPPTLGTYVELHPPYRMADEITSRSGMVRPFQLSDFQHCQICADPPMKGVSADWCRFKVRNA